MHSLKIKQHTSAYSLDQSGRTKIEQLRSSKNFLISLRKKQSLHFYEPTLAHSRQRTQILTSKLLSKLQRTFLHYILAKKINATSKRATTDFYPSKLYRSQQKKIRNAKQKKEQEQQLHKQQQLTKKRHVNFIPKLRLEHY